MVRNVILTLFNKKIRCEFFHTVFFYLIGNYYLCSVCNFLYYTKVYLNPPRLGLMLAGGKRLSTTEADSVDQGVDMFFKTLFYKSP